MHKNELRMTEVALILKTDMEECPQGHQGLPQVHSEAAAKANSVRRTSSICSLVVEAERLSVMASVVAQVCELMFLGLTLFLAFDVYSIYDNIWIWRLPDHSHGRTKPSAAAKREYGTALYAGSVAAVADFVRIFTAISAAKFVWH